MNTDQRPKYYLYVRAFENAKWILTDNNSGEVSEYNYSEMSKVVKDGYVSWYNNYLAKPPYNQEEENPENLRVRYLRQAGCLIARINKRDVVGVGYSQILPDYTIDCYDWRYQCPHCEAVQDEIREKEPKEVIRFYCLSCHEFTEFNP